MTADRRDDLRQEAEKLLSVFFQDKAAVASCSSDKLDSWVHCGRTKVFLTQPMVSH